MSAPYDPYAGSSKKAWIWISIAGVLLAMTFGVVVGSSGVLGKMFGQGDNTTQVQGEGQKPVLPLVGSAPQATTPVVGEKIMMPADIYNWLLHLERIEKERERISLQQMGEVTTAMTMLSLGGTAEIMQGLLDGNTDVLDEPPTANLQLDAAASREVWSGLDRQFESVPPPAECAQIYSSYDETLGETSRMMVEVIQALENSGSNPQNALSALYGMRGTSGDRVGDPAARTDDLVQAVCDRYGTRKWFTISRDFGGGGGSFGVGGGLPSLPNINLP
jgi:hypothetical protein